MSMCVLVCITWPQTSATHHFLRAVLETHDGRLQEARAMCHRAREAMSTEFAALVSCADGKCSVGGTAEQGRAGRFVCIPAFTIVKSSPEITLNTQALFMAHCSSHCPSLLCILPQVGEQQLTELEEVIDYRAAVAAMVAISPRNAISCGGGVGGGSAAVFGSGLVGGFAAAVGSGSVALPGCSPVERMAFTQQTWRDRLKGVQRHVEVSTSVCSTHGGGSGKEGGRVVGL